MRLALLKAHYRSELTWSEELLKESKAQLDGWYRQKEYFEDFGQAIPLDNVMLGFSELFDDLNLPMMLSELTNISDEVSKAYSDIIKGGDEEFRYDDPTLMANKVIEIDYSLKRLNLIGLLKKDTEDWFKGNASDDDHAEFDAIAKRREDARARKDWAAADAARDEAKEKGIVLEDGPNGTTWRKA